MSLWMLQTKTSHLWKVIYAIILLGWRSTNDIWTYENLEKNLIYLPDFVCQQCILTSVQHYNVCNSITCRYLWVCGHQHYNVHADNSWLCFVFCRARMQSIDCAEYVINTLYWLGNWHSWSQWETKLLSTPTCSLPGLRALTWCQLGHYVIFNWYAKCNNKQVLK